MTDTVSNLHVRHDPDGHGPVCRPLTLATCLSPSLSWNEAPGDVPEYDDAPAEDSTAAPEDVEVRS